MSPRIPAGLLNLKELTQHLRLLALRAGAAIMPYHGPHGQPLHLAHKADKTPVTAADHAGERVILKGLAQLAPDIPAVSEEAAARGCAPRIGSRFFLVDPVDGTREFLRHSGEFTVNIALVEDAAPVAGVIYAPVQERMYYAARPGLASGYAFAQDIAPDAESLEQGGPAVPLAARPPPEDGLTAVTSRSHRNNTRIQKFLDQHPVRAALTMGSSLKFCMIAAAEADLYPRPGRTMEWDTAAGHAILLAAGGQVTLLDGTPLLYGKTAVGFENPGFAAWGAARRDSQPGPGTLDSAGVK